jgi:hypothetical protein
MRLEKRRRMAYSFLRRALERHSTYVSAPPDRGYQLGFHFFTHLRPGALQKFAFHPLQLQARRAHQVLAASPAQRRQIRFAHDTAVKHPDRPRSP